MKTTTHWIPNIHPILVHFPIALLFIAITIELTGLVIKKYQQAAFIADVLIWIGTLFGLVTLFSGLLAANAEVIPDAAKAAVVAHALTAKTTITFFTLYSILRIFRYRNRKKLKPVFIIVIFLLGCIGLFGVYMTGERGAKLVYKYGIGIKK